VNDPGFKNFSKTRYNSTLRTLNEILKSSQRSQAELKLIKTHLLKFRTIKRLGVHIAELLSAKCLLVEFNQGEVIQNGKERPAYLLVPLDPELEVLGRKVGCRILAAKKISYIGIMQHVLKTITDEVQYPAKKIALDHMLQIFNFAANERVTNLLYHGRLKFYDEGEVLIKRGDNVKDYMIVVSGGLVVQDEIILQKKNLWPDRICRNESQPFKWVETVNKKKRLLNLAHFTAGTLFGVTELLGQVTSEF
jgi:hypothetical protein